MKENNIIRQIENQKQVDINKKKLCNNHDKVKYNYCLSNIIYYKI